MTKQELILAFCLLAVATIITASLALATFGQVYEDGSFVITGCIPFQLCD